MLMLRVYFWRFLYIVALIGSVLQVTGFFLPFARIVDARTNTTLLVDTYWMPLIHPSATGPARLVGAFLSLLVFLAMLVPLSVALVELFSGPRRSSAMRLLSMILGICWFAQYVAVAFVSATMPNICLSDQFDPDCPLGGDFGSGFLPTCIGSLLSTGCFIILSILGYIWWNRDTLENHHTIERL
jgi:hypothetical protein